MKARFAWQAQVDQLRDRQLGELGVRRYAPGGDKVPFEPTLYGSVTDPSFSALTNDNNRLRAKFIRTGDRFDLWFSLKIGTGFSAGAGAWTMNLPDGIETSVLATGLAYTNLGIWQARRSSVSSLVFGPITVVTSNSGRVAFEYPATSPIGTPTSIGHTTPWTWASNDEFGGHISFPVA